MTTNTNWNRWINDFWSGVVCKKPLKFWKLTLEFRVNGLFIPFFCIHWIFACCAIHLICIQVNYTHKCIRITMHLQVSSNLFSSLPFHSFISFCVRLSPSVSRIPIDRWMNEDGPFTTNWKDFFFFCSFACFDPELFGEFLSNFLMIVIFGIKSFFFDNDTNPSIMTDHGDHDSSSFGIMIMISWVYTVIVNELVSMKDFWIERTFTFHAIKILFTFYVLYSLQTSFVCRNKKYESIG